MPEESLATSHRLFQVATLAVYFYFLAALMGAQWVYPESGDNYEKIYDLPVFSNNGKWSLPIWSIARKSLGVNSVSMCNMVPKLY